VATLQHPDVDVQRASAKVLASLGTGGLLPVAEALAGGKAASEPAAYVLGELLGQTREDVFYNPQLDAAKFRELAEPILRTVTPALIQLLADPREETRQDAIRALAQMGFPAAPFLVKTLAGDNAAARAAALEALVRLEPFLPRESPASAGVEAMKPKLVPPLLELLQQSEPKVRAAACRVLAEFSLGRAPLETAEPQLREALKDSDVAVRRYASKALEQLRPKEKEK
jgi:HEAT repeat protein